MTIIQEKRMLSDRSIFVDYFHPAFDYRTRMRLSIGVMHPGKTRNVTITARETRNLAQALLPEADEFERRQEAERKRAQRIWKRILKTKG